MCVQIDRLGILRTVCFVEADPARLGKTNTVSQYSQQRSECASQYKGWTPVRLSQLISLPALKGQQEL